MGYLLTFFLSTATTFVLVHIVATKFFLYWKYLWFDIPMHFLGGIVCALGIAILPFFNIRYIEKRSSFFLYIVLVLAIGVSWELYEYNAGLYHLESNLVPDTILDLCMDVLGGVVGYGIVKSSKYINS